MKRRIFKSAISVMLCAALLTVSMFTVSVFADDTAPSVELKNAVVRVDDSIGLKVTISAKNVNANTVKLIANGTEYTAAKNADDDFEAVVLKYPSQMMEKISLKATAVGIDGKTYESAEKNNYTIAGNLEELYNKEETDGTTKNFIAKLANYGAYTQIYAAASKGQTLDADDLANYFLAAEDKTPSSEAYLSCENVRKLYHIKDEFGNKPYGDFELNVTVLLKSKVSLYFRLDDFEEKLLTEIDKGITTHLYLGTSVKDPNRVEMEEHLVYDADNEPAGVYYTAEYGPFAPTEYNKAPLLQMFLCDENDNILISTIQFAYSVESYIRNKGGNEKSSQQLRNLLNAMAEYTSAAKEMNKTENA